MLNKVSYKAYLAAAALASAADAATLSGYNADPNSVSVSGLSSGGFMAAQLGVAYSDTFKAGFGVFAGGPFDCARNQGVSYLRLTAQLGTYFRGFLSLT